MGPDQEPFEAWELEEMEKLLKELRGHLGEKFSTPKRDRPTDASISHISNTILRRRRYRQQFPLQRRQAPAIPNLHLTLPHIHRRDPPERDQSDVCLARLYFLLIL